MMLYMYKLIEALIAYKNWKTTRERRMWALTTYRNSGGYKEVKAGF